MDVSTYVWWDQLGYMAAVYVAVAKSEDEAKSIVRGSLDDPDDADIIFERYKLRVLTPGEFFKVD